MLQAVLLGAAVGSTSAFVPSVRTSLGSSSPAGGLATSAVPGSASVQAMSNWGRVEAPRRSFRSRAVEAHGLQMVSAGIEKGMFTTSNPDDRRVTPETRDGKAYFKVSPVVGVREVTTPRANLALGNGVGVGPIFRDGERAARVVARSTAASSDGVPCVRCRRAASHTPRVLSFPESQHTHTWVLFCSCFFFFLWEAVL